MSEPHSNASTLTIAPPLFNQLSADITLRTSDLVDFHVHSQILSQASLTFENMLSLPQPPSSSGIRPLIDVSEDSKTLENLLFLCYPVDRIPLTSVTHIGLVLDAANKYEMLGALSTAMPDLLELVPYSPLKVWAVTCRSGLIFGYIAQYAAAAMVTISQDRRQLAKHFGRLSEAGSGSSLSSGSYPVPPLRLLELMLAKYGVDAMSGASAGDYYRLLEYLRAGDQQSTAMLLYIPIGTPPFGPTPSPPSLDDVIPRFPPPDVKIQCSDGTEHCAHILFLSTHSPTLRDRIRAIVAAGSESSTSTVAAAPSAHSTGPPPLPVLEMDTIDSATLSTLLAFCYASCAGDAHLPSDLRLLTSTLIAARQLDMDRVAEAMRARWERIAEGQPLEAYFVAIKHGQEDLARLAARQTLECRVAGPGAYVRGMEACPALAYHRLLEYHGACAQAAREVVDAAVEKLRSDPDMVAWAVTARCASGHISGSCHGGPYRMFLRGSELGKSLLSGIVRSLQHGPASSSFPYPPCQGLCWRSVAKITKLVDSVPQSVADAVAKVQLELAFEA